MTSAEHVAGVANVAWTELWRVLLTPRAEIFDEPEESTSDEAAVDAEPTEGTDAQ